MTYKQKIGRELKDFFRLKPQNRPWAVPILAMMCVGSPLFIGLAMGNILPALTVSFSGLVILYMPVKANFVSRMTKLLVCSFGFMVSYSLGLIFSFHPIASFVAFAVFCGVIHYISLWLKLGGPGSFFFIMLATMGGSATFNPSIIPRQIGLVAMGTMLACIFALIYSLITRESDEWQKSKDVITTVPLNRYADSVEAFIVGIFMLIAMVIGHAFGFKKPYWIPVSCIAVMQGATTKHIWTRGLHRIIGTWVGMVLCWAILSLVKDLVLLCVLIAALQFIVEVFVTRNYGLAVIFITPLTVLLVEAGSPLAQHPTELIATRMVDVLIGSVIGAIGGWFVYNEKIRYQAVKRIRMTRVFLKRGKTLS